MSKMCLKDMLNGAVSNLSGLTVLAAPDEDVFQLEVARKLRLEKEAEAKVAGFALAEAQAAVARRKAEEAEAQAAVARRTAEVQLAKLREEGAQSLVRYFSQVKDRAIDQALDLELHIGTIRHRIQVNKADVPAPAPSYMNLKDDSYDELYEAVVSSSGEMSA
ncbi:hypothetical protein DFH06DRAFT_1347373 [Mycena polygramma]|nr:hypothetical protein DFH06DRAFT_1347373 [Mycena polygramma]